jgi:hypothetical protein
MKAWDAEHDCNAKTLLNGLILPARTSSVPDTGTATLLDLNAAMDNLFGHTNVRALYLPSIDPALRDLEPLHRLPGPRVRRV